jgi:hypothetical protein
MEMAAQGQGVFSTPCYIARPHLEAGRVVRVLPEYESETLPIYAVYPNRRHLSAKVRAFTGFFAEWMREQAERQWREQNRDAVEAYHRRVVRDGLFSEGFSRSTVS